MAYKDPEAERAYKQTYNAVWRTPEKNRRYARNWYAAHPDVRRAGFKGFTDFRANLVNWYKQAHPCVDCGEADPEVLDFDHVRGEKLVDVCHARRRKLSVLWAEIQKCEVVCANCHRRRTRRREREAHGPA